MVRSYLKKTVYGVGYSHIKTYIKIGYDMSRSNHRKIISHFSLTCLVKYVHESAAALGKTCEYRYEQVLG